MTQALAGQDDVTLAPLVPGTPNYVQSMRLTVLATICLIDAARALCESECGIAAQLMQERVRKIAQDAIRVMPGVSGRLGALVRRVEVAGKRSTLSAMRADLHSVENDLAVLQYGEVRA